MKKFLSDQALVNEVLQREHFKNYSDLARHFYRNPSQFSRIAKGEQHLGNRQIRQELEEIMQVGEIARVLLDSGEVVHAAKNIELQNMTNSLSDEDLSILWNYVRRMRLNSFSEEENGVLSARYIAKSVLEDLAGKG